jgi:hypothetical protein
MTPPAPRSASASTSAPVSAADEAEPRTPASDAAADVAAADVAVADVDVDVDDERDSDAPTGERIARPRQPVSAPPVTTPVVAPPATTPVAAAPAVAAPAAGLTEREERILAFERQWWKHAGAKEQAIRDQFEISATRYYQAVNSQLVNTAALIADPLLVRRLRRLRATRARARRAAS